MQRYSARDDTLRYTVVNKVATVTSLDGEGTYDDILYDTNFTVLLRYRTNALVARVTTGLVAFMAVLTAVLAVLFIVDSNFKCEAGDQCVPVGIFRIDYNSALPDKRDWWNVVLSTASRQSPQFYFVGVAVAVLILYLVQIFMRAVHARRVNQSVHIFRLLELAFGNVVLTLWALWLSGLSDLPVSLMLMLGVGVGYALLYLLANISDPQFYFHHSVDPVNVAGDNRKLDVVTLAEQNAVHDEYTRSKAAAEAPGAGGPGTAIEMDAAAGGPVQRRTDRVDILTGRALPASTRAMGVRWPRGWRGRKGSSYSRLGDEDPPLGDKPSYKKCVKRHAGPICVYGMTKTSRWLAVFVLGLVLHVLFEALVYWHVGVTAARSVTNLPAAWLAFYVTPTVLGVIVPFVLLLQKYRVGGLAQPWNVEVLLTLVVPLRFLTGMLSIYFLILK